MAHPRIGHAPAPGWADLLPPSSGSWRPKNTRHTYVGSGKAGITLILDYLRQQGVLVNKMSELVVPRWLGVAVYQTMAASAFPTSAIGPDAKALWVYHQYGFPQDMDRLLEFAHDRKLVVIEDCAHACDSYYKGRRLGTLGRFALYSYSKFVFCYTLGGVEWIDDAGFAEFLACRAVAGSRMLRAFINGFKLVDEANLAHTNCLPGLMLQLRKAAYSAYGDSPCASSRAVRAWESKAEAELAVRRANYRFILESAGPWGLCEGLEPGGITPFAVPLRVPVAKVEVAAAALRGLGIDAGPYRFDYSRFMLEPDFHPCVLLPCHGDISREFLWRLLETVRGAL